MNLSVDCKEFCYQLDSQHLANTLTYSYTVQAPFGRLFGDALAFHMPCQRRDTLGDDVYVVFRLYSNKFWNGPTIILQRTSIVSSTLMTPGCRKVLNFRRAFFARGCRPLLLTLSKVKTLQGFPSSYVQPVRIDNVCALRQNIELTRLVALCSVHMEGSRSTRSPRAYGKELPFEMAEATADLRKSIEL